jgi:hypothetical protein
LLDWHSGQSISLSYGPSRLLKVPVQLNPEAQSCSSRPE